MQGSTSDVGSGTGQLDTLTGLRWFAAFAVFLHHAGVRLGLGDQGPVGVSFFFILSGFVLAWSSSKRVAAPVFYRRRFARIYPAHAVVTICVIAVVVLTADRTHSLAKDLFTLTLLHAWVPSPSVNAAGNSPSWSLSAEAFFYACFPFLEPRVSRLATREIQGLLAGLVALGLTIPLVVRAATQLDLAYWFTYAFPIVRIIEFVIGICLAHLLRRGGLPRVPLILGVAVALGGYLVAGRVPLYAQSVPVTLVPFCVLIVAAAQADITGNSWRILHSKLLVTLGRWSFAFYLVHEPIITNLRRAPFLGTHYLVRTAAALPTAIVASALLFNFVERPLERRLRGASGPVRR